MFSNITYFKKSDAEEPEPNVKIRRHTYVVEEPFNVNYESTEADSTSRQCTSLNLPETVKNLAEKKSSFSDTDLLNLKVATPIRKKRLCKKLKLDVKKASQSMNTLNCDSNVENTPKHVHLECKSSDVFSERFRGLDFNKSFNLIDALSDDQSSSPFEEDFDIESLSEHSDSDISMPTNKSSIKMCRKVSDSQSSDDKQIVPSVSIESFADIEVDRNEEERVRLLDNYRTKLEKSHISSIPDNIDDIPKMLKEMMDVNKTTNKNSLSDSWNIILEKEDSKTKYKVKKHLLSMKRFIDEFVRSNLQNSENSDTDSKIRTRPVKKCQRYVPKHANISRKKKIKHFDFPDLREAMLNLFNLDDQTHDTTIDISSSEESDTSKCMCKCHNTSSDTDSAATSTVNDQSMSITSSIGNFSLDLSELTAYSESLDQIVSYNSFQDTSLYGTLLQKAAIERISFYVQVHSIQLKCEPDLEFESRNTLTFHCPPCKDIQMEENGLLRHILSLSHCEKIHFLYKTVYIKKCVAAGKEIQPSTVLNPMKMYRDDNKIVCFGDALYACTLCFENLIVGESVLMTHCCEPQHIERKEKLAEIIG
ncbi:jg13483 [Pararge aegeria aegeria]|uniref:Jg13483 protein n=1 Tax=Pararge aegeria aegeria TaxID=348720 RepID=A0A8S4RLW1_9NEOP|nr:jg13483 [Pararge aegeria aegeria]